MHTKNILFKIYDGDKSIAYNWFETMNTRIDIVLCNVSENEFARLIEVIEDMVMQLHFIANRFDPYSELSKINKNAYQQEIKVSAALYAPIKMALTYIESTLGLFDISIHSANHSFETYKKIDLNDTDSSIRFLEKDITLDLNGFIKGYVLDEIHRFLRENKVSDAMINLGNSSILAIGNQPHGVGWEIAMNPEHAESQRRVKLLNECLSTSGNLTDVHSHIINPHTGKLIENRKTVSVITKSGAVGEALSTAFFVANEEERRIIEERFGVRCL